VVLGRGRSVVLDHKERARVLLHVDQKVVHIDHHHLIEGNAPRLEMSFFASKLPKLLQNIVIALIVILL
jgi:hypothetical protein